MFRLFIDLRRIGIRETEEVARARITTGNARHGSFIELGAPGRGIPAQPFLRPALFDNRSAERAEFLKELESAIREEGFKDFKAKYDGASRVTKKVFRGSD
jgi:hypothetical protein